MINETYVQGFYYETLDSTQDEAKRLIQAEKINKIAFVVANQQTLGRGTHGKVWSSPKNAGIYMSVVHLPKKTNGSTNPCFDLTTIYTLAAGIACAEAINETTGINIYLKPINDIYIENKKLGGLLVESKLQGIGISSLITGVGLNTHKSKHEIDLLETIPISLEEVLDSKTFNLFSKEDLIKKIVEKISFWYSYVFNGNHKIIEDTWEKWKLVK